MLFTDSGLNEVLRFNRVAETTTKQKGEIFHIGLF